MCAEHLPTWDKKSIFAHSRTSQSSPLDTLLKYVIQQLHAKPLKRESSIPSLFVFSLRTAPELFIIV